MDSPRADAWKALLREENILQGEQLSATHTVEFRFAHDTSNVSYILDPATTRCTGLDKGHYIVFYTHGRHPVYHLWDDIVSITMRT
jgi:hypothetical protein